MTCHGRNVDGWNGFKVSIDHVDGNSEVPLSGLKKRTIFLPKSTDGMNRWLQAISRTPNSDDEWCGKQMLAARTPINKGLCILRWFNSLQLGNQSPSLIAKPSTNLSFWTILGSWVAVISKPGGCNKNCRGSSSWIDTDPQTWKHLTDRNHRTNMEVGRIHTYICIYIYIYMYMYVYIYIYVCIYIYV